MTVAQELERRLFTLVGDVGSWVHRVPRVGEQCLAWDRRGPDRYLNQLDILTLDFLGRFCWDYAGLTASKFNDTHTKQEIVWMLQEAIDEAKDLNL